MTALIETTSTCVAVTGRCVGCRRWHCPHLLKRLAGQWLCAACWPKEAK